MHLLQSNAPEKNTASKVSWQDVGKVSNFLLDT